MLTQLLLVSCHVDRVCSADEYKYSMCSCTRLRKTPHTAGGWVIILDFQLIKLFFFHLKKTNVSIPYQKSTTLKCLNDFNNYISSVPTTQSKMQNISIVPGGSFMSFPKKSSYHQRKSLFDFYRHKLVFPVLGLI